MYCLPKYLANEFLRKIKAGEITPERLTEMSSKERQSFFSEIFGEEHAKKVNAHFESKLLLKNQQQGIITWAKRIGGLKPEVKRDILSRVEKMTEILQPAEQEAFLNDLASQRLGVGVTFEEAGKIAELAKLVSDKKAAMEKGGDRMEWGRAKVAFGNYVSDLKYQAKRKTFKEAITSPVYLVSETSGNAKAIKASLDNSAIFRQGWKTLWTHPKQWARNAKRSFVDIVESFGEKEVLDEVKADIHSRPNYDLYRKAKLAIGTVEEEYPSHLPRKIPIFGKAYKASETAFTGFVYRQRADVFDSYADIAKKTGVDLADKFEIESIGRLVNALTGRGALGRLEPVADVANNVFFSPRLLKSNIDTLTVHALDPMSKFARKQAAINLLKIVGGTAAVLTTANALKPGSVEIDPRSADFGKIRIGNTRFDVSGGMASIITLASRLISMSTKSSTTGKIRSLQDRQYGAPTGTDVIYNFMENKLSPAASVVKDLLKGEDFQGNKPTVTGELSNLLTPIIITNYQELRDDPNSANILLAMIADGLGIGTNTYSSQSKSLNTLNTLRRKP